MIIIKVKEKNSGGMDFYASSAQGDSVPTEKEINVLEIMLNSVGVNITKTLLGDDAIKGDLGLLKVFESQEGVVGGN